LFNLAGLAARSDEGASTPCNRDSLLIALSIVIRNSGSTARRVPMKPPACGRAGRPPMPAQYLRSADGRSSINCAAGIFIPLQKGCFLQWHGLC